MPITSNFPFVDDEIMRENLDIVFDHLTELTYLCETPRYNSVLKSSFRKTTIDIYKINKEERIVLGKDVIKTEQFKFSKLNLVDINSICKNNGIITEKMFKAVDKVRELRNRLHIGTLEVVEKDYTKIDLEFVFSVAREVKNLAKG